MITAKNEIFSLFPPGRLVYKTNGEIASPCPFCVPGKWTGEDRFYFPPKANGGACRRCKQEGRKSWYTYQDIVDLLKPGEIVSEDLLFDALQEQIDQREVYPEAISDDHINLLHSNVKREYWYRFGWSDEVIDHFKLGFGQLRPFSKKMERHTIPMRLIRDDGETIEWAIEGRTGLSEDLKGEPRVKQTSGLMGKQWFWLVQEDDTNPTLYISEGAKDTVSAWAIGYRNILTVFGTERWDYPIAELLYKIGYRSIIVAGDNDEPGQHLNQFVAQTFHRWKDVKVCSVMFDGFPAKADTTNILERHRDGARAWIESHLSNPIEPPVQRGLIQDFTQIDPNYAPARPPVVESLDTYRAAIAADLRHFLINYDTLRKEAQAKNGLLKVFAPPTGAGKSYVMVQESERLAKLKQDEVERKKLEIHKEVVQLQNRRLELMEKSNLTIDEQLILSEIDDTITTLQKRYNSVKQVAVLYAGPFVTGWDDLKQQGIDESLWFNYEARNPDNCQDYDAVTALANKGYTARAYCNTGCAFKTTCSASGYLAQDKQRLFKPITYVRHQNLLTSMVEDYHHIFIDENPLHVFDTPLVVGQEQLIPSYDGWDDQLDLVMVDKINLLISGLRRILADGKNLSGESFLQALDEAVGCKLNDLLTVPQDLVEQFQPETVYNFQDIDTLPIRCVPILYKVIREEWNFYIEHQGRYNSRLNTTESGKLLVYPLEKVHISRTRPIVIADGTALPELYGKLFDRELMVYSPEIHNPDSQTTVLYGSDFTRTNIRQQTGKALADFEKWAASASPIIEDVFGEAYNLDDIPFDEKMYESTALQKALALIKNYADKHESLLVVTYKSIRLLLEHRLFSLYPSYKNKVHFGHYGALRGTNRFKEVEAALLIGCYRQPYADLHRRIQAWAWLDEPEFYIPFEIIIKQAPYHGHFMGNSFPTFSDEFAQRFVDMIEQGEMRQSLDRIRIHTSGRPKFGYLAMNRPVARWVNAIRPMSQIVQINTSHRYGKALKYVQEVYNEHGKFPIVRKIMEEFKISAKTYSKIKEEVMKNANT